MKVRVSDSPDKRTLLRLPNFIVHFPFREKYGYCPGEWHRRVKMVKTHDVRFVGKSVLIKGQRKLKCNVYSRVAGQWVRLDYSRLVDDESGTIYLYAPPAVFMERPAFQDETHPNALKVTVPNMRFTGEPVTDPDADEKDIEDSVD